MYSSVPNGTNIDSLGSESLRSNNEHGKKGREEREEPLLVEASDANSIDNDRGSNGVVTTEHAVSSSSQSSLSRHGSRNSMEYTPLKSNQSAEDETVINSEQVGEGSMTTESTNSSPVRQREKGKERRAHEKVSWRQSQAGGPTLRDVSPQRNPKGQGQEQEQTGEDHTKSEKLESLNIALFPTDKLLEMLTALLDKIVKSNDRLMDTSSLPYQQHEYDNSAVADKCLKSVMSFRGKHIPQISLEQYFQRIQKYCPTSNDVFLSLLVYFDRISRKCNSNTQRPNDNANNNDNNYNGSYGNVKKQGYSDKQQTPAAPQQQFVMDSHNIHRLIIAGTTVSTKFFSDFFYSNSRYARVGGISLQELNYLELQFLVLCDFELLISVNELQRYADLLYRFWNKSKPHSSE